MMAASLRMTVRMMMVPERIPSLSKTMRHRPVSMHPHNPDTT